MLARSEFDPHGPLELKRVEEVFVRRAPVVELVVRGKIIGTTAEHPFYVVERGQFVPAHALVVGETLLGYDGQPSPLEALRDTGRIADVFVSSSSECARVSVSTFQAGNLTESQRHGGSAGTRTGTD